MKLINNWGIIFEVPKKWKKCYSASSGHDGKSCHVLYPMLTYVYEGVIKCNMIRGLSTHCDNQEETKTKIVVPFQSFDGKDMCGKDLSAGRDFSLNWMITINDLVLGSLVIIHQFFPTL